MSINSEFSLIETYHQKGSWVKCLRVKVNIDVNYKKQHYDKDLSSKYHYKSVNTKDKNKRYMTSN